MANRNLRHIILNGSSEAKNFIAKLGRGGLRPSSVQDHAEHARELINAIDAIDVVSTASATYIEIFGHAGEPFLSDKFNVSGLSVLNSEDANPADQIPGRVVVRASRVENGLGKLKSKIEAFGEESDENVNTRPKHADLANSIDTIALAGLDKLWRHPTKPFPSTSDSLFWEVWLEPDENATFVAKAREQELIIHDDQLKFPEDIVVLVEGTIEQLANTVTATGAVRAVSPLGAPIDFVDGIEVEEQNEWVDDLLQRTEYQTADDGTASYVTILDTGVSLAHKLIKPVLDEQDRHVAISGWELGDRHGHGTQMAGLALFGDLRSILHSTSAITVTHRIESSKIIPDGTKNPNPHHLLGVITQKAIDAVEVGSDRVRTFALATTTSDDTPHSGAPTSWSTELDQLAAGVSGNEKKKRLIVVSAGNLSSEHDGTVDYLANCDLAEIESPAQAWNTIAVGAMTDMDGRGGETYGFTLAKVGDLAPMSRTASWKKTWPIKPDVVLEGSNWYKDGGNTTPNTHSDLMLVTTSHEAPTRSFTHMRDTSAATALAARELAMLRAKYPDLWPETIRALYVSSARWTDQMWSHIHVDSRHRKAAMDVLFQRYGFGRPDVERALRSANNAVTLIAQDKIMPYEAGSRPRKLNEMKLFELPWPVGVLREMGNTKVTLRIALSSFVEPNPSEVARGRKHRYGSHGLRFDLKREDETIEQFTERVGHTAIDENQDEIGPVSDEWKFGYRRRSVGSLHIDTLTIRASDLAQRGVLAVYPVGGWWKDSSKVDPKVDPERCIARFALVAEIDAEKADVDLYAEVEIANKSVAVLAEF